MVTSSGTPSKRWLAQTPLSSAAQLALTALLPLVTGCGGGIELLPASGVVAIDGQPVADAGVLFQPVDGGPVASGTTDTNGKFHLTTMNRTGAVSGQHRVTITKNKTVGVHDFGVVGPQGVQTKWIIPQKYSEPEASGLRASVSRNQHEFTFALSSQ